jgi:hypothetical protein
MEHLISKRLDGELSEDQELQLNRQLIRDPAAHRMMEQSERIDRLASAALAELFVRRAGTDAASIPGALPRRRSAVPRSSRWLIPGTIAAALLALVIPRPDVSRGPEPALHANRSGAPQQRSIPVNGAAPGDLYRNVNVPTTQRSLGRDVIGVVGDDGNLYWIEIDRSRTLRLTPPSAGSRDSQRM